MDIAERKQILAGRKEQLGVTCHLENYIVTVRVMVRVIRHLCASGFFGNVDDRKKSDDPNGKTDYMNEGTNTPDDCGRFSRLRSPDNQSGDDGLIHACSTLMEANTPLTVPPESARTMKGLLDWCEKKAVSLLLFQKEYDSWESREARFLEEESDSLRQRFFVEHGAGYTEPRPLKKTLVLNLPDRAPSNTAVEAWLSDVTTDPQVANRVAWEDEMLELENIVEVERQAELNNPHDDILGPIKKVLDEWEGKKAKRKRKTESQLQRDCPKRR